MANITIYSTIDCPNCKILKHWLGRKNVCYKEIDMTTPMALTELRMNGVFAMSAPILQIDDKYYTQNELFVEGRIDNNKLENIAK